MKKITAIICLAAFVCGITACGESPFKDNNNSNNNDKAIESPIESTTVPRRKVQPEDFIGKWVPVSMIRNGKVYDESLGDIPLYGLYQLEIKNDKTGSIVGKKAEESDVRGDFKWNAENGRLSLSFGEDKCVFGMINGDSLFVTDGDELKVCFEKTDEFYDFDIDNYIELFEKEEGIEDIPSVADLFFAGGDISEEDILGKWKCSLYSIDGEDYTEDFLGLPLDALFQTEFFSGGKAEFRVGGNDADAEILEYIWEIDENGIISLYYADDNEFSSYAELVDGKLCIENGSDFMQYEKTDEFADFDWNSLDSADTAATGG